VGGVVVQDDVQLEPFRDLTVHALEEREELGVGVLIELGAPAEVVDDIRQRRYGDPDPPSQPWIARRAELTLGFLRPALERTVATRHRRQPT
jgi:hypothetical protein